MRIVSAYAVAVFLLGSGCDSPDKIAAQNVSRGNIIAAAMESYRSENGRYPGNLEELVPKYLSSIPALEQCRDNWGYQPGSDRQTYVLSFSGAGGNYNGALSSGHKDDWWIDSK